ncbi:RNA-binding protein 34 [Caerostris darwini]|uniref:RNA-binding protein 34 n=1 Tax=Caerostris darwini TaxID=1538125 RepID=A0AAV4WIR7_9ARAC|nr:RNA-binding protein 34 [Caerostris darwini]
MYKKLPFLTVIIHKTLVNKKMPKYKVGDVAALFSKPSVPQTNTGKKLQSLFDKIHNKSKPSKVKVEEKELSNVGEKMSKVENKNKLKKRKFQGINDTLNETDGHPKKVKKCKTEPVDEETYFPRNKKKSKNFNLIQEKSSVFPKMHFDENEDDDFSLSKEQPVKKIKNAVKSENSSFETKKSLKKKKKLHQALENDDLTKSVVEKKANIKQSAKKMSPIKKKKEKKIKMVQQDSSDSEVENENLVDEGKVEPRKSKILFQTSSKSTSIKNNSNSADSLKKEINISKEKEPHTKPEENKERLSRTIFIGNLPMDFSQNALKQLFSPFGAIETCRLRGGIPVKESIPKKVACIKNKFHTGQKHRIGFVVFKEEKDAANAETMNGTLISDHHIVVNRASAAGNKKQYDEKRSIFIGNLPFDVEDDAVWSAFAECGEIEAVRIIRDRDSGVGKGFGYVLFKSMQSKQDALALENVRVSDRIIRIKQVQSSTKKTINNKQNALKRKAYKQRNKEGNRKSLKKLMKRAKICYEKKKIAKAFKNFSL